MKSTPSSEKPANPGIVSQTESLHLDGEKNQDSLESIIDVPAIQAIMDDFYALTNIGMAIIDDTGKILIATGWQEICTRFHRIHHETREFCIESDTILSKDIEPGSYKLYKCKNNLWDIATPIIIGEKHKGNLFLGQFFFDDEVPDRDFFVEQARKYGFNENEYLAALEKVPRWSRQKVDTVMHFYIRFANQISSLGYSNQRLVKTLDDQNLLLKALHQKEALLNITQKMSKIGGWEWDIEKQTMFWTEEVYRIHDLDPEVLINGMPEHISKSIECYYPDDRPVILAAFNKCATEGTPYELEFPFLTAKGRKAWIRTSAYALTENGKITKVIGNILDITEIKEAGLRQKMLEDRYRNFFEKDITGNYLSTPEGRLLDCNPAFVKMLGYPSKEELLSIDTNRLYPMPFDRTNFLEKLIKNKTLFHSDIVMVRKDGKFIHCVENVIGFFDEQGNLKQFQGYLIDETRSRASERQANLLSQAIKGVTECISITDTDNKIIYINEAFTKTYGYTQSELLGKHVTILHAFKDKNFLNNVVRKTQNGGWRGELMNKRKDGTVFPIELSTSEVKDVDGKVFAYAGVAKDITQSRAASQALKESEEKFSIAFRSSPYGIIITRLPDSHIVDVNDALCTMSGYSRQEILGDSTVNLKLWLHPEDRNQVIAELKNRQPVHGREYLFRKKSGEIIVGLFSAEIMTINNELCILSSVNDITSRKKAEENLRKSEVRWRTIIKTSPDGIAISTIDGFITELSDVGAKMYGYEKHEEILGRHILEFLDQSCHEKAKSRIKQLFDGTYTGVAEYLAVKKDGSRFYVEINSEILRDKDGKPTHLLFIERDITERKEAEEKLRKSEERLRLLVKNSSDIIVAISPEGIQKYVSPSVERITGFTPEEVTNLNISELVHPDDMPEVYRVWLEAVANPDALQRVQYRHKHKTRGWVHLEAIGQSLIHVPEIEAVVGSVRDMTERMESELALKESEMRLTTLINASPDIICFKDGEGRWMIANQADLELFELTNTDYYGKTDKELSELCNPAYKEALSTCTKTDEIAWQAKTITISEEIINRPDGSKRILEVIKIPIVHQDGSRRALIVLGRNVTERKRTELIQRIQYNIANAMVDAENLNELFEKVRDELKVLVDTSNIFIALYDEKTDMLTSPFIKNEKGDNIQSWPAANSLTGLIIYGKKPLLLSKQDIAGLAEQGKIALRGSRSEKWLGVPLEINDKVFGAIVVQSFDNPNAYDQTSMEILEIIAHQLSIYIERKKSEEMSRKLSAAIVQSPESIVITDKRGNIEYINPKFTDLTGYTLEEVIGQTPRILKSGEHSKEFYQNLWDTILSGQRWTGELHDKKKSGELYWESANISPILNEEGEITHFVAVKEDITEKKKMIEELISAKDKAEAANRLKTAFMNNISHEVRTPLNGILGFAEALCDPEITEEEKQKALKILNAGSERLINTITSYMDLALIASGNMEVHPGKTAPAEILQSLFSEFETRCIDKNLEFKLLLQPECQNLVISTDPELLKKIMLQLLDNALKFTSKGHIHFGMKKEESSVTIFVTDTGTGIGKEFQGRIFEHFSQEDTTITRKFEGSGVGLAIVKGLCDLLQIKIQLTSQKGYGTSFHLSFFTAETFPNTGTSGAHIAEILNPLVLVVEDEADNYAYMEIVLQKCKTNILWAKNGKEAVEFCRANPGINLIFMDLKMPVMNGLEATQIIKSFSPETPVVAVTAYAMSGDERLALDAGCDDYVSKPVKKDTIISKLRKYGLAKNQ